VINHRPLAA